MRKPKPLTISQLKEKIRQLGADKVDLENTLETEEAKVKNLREQKEKLGVKLATAEERVNATVQAMNFIITYCAKAVHDEIPPGHSEPTNFERIIGTPEGSVMAWSTAKNWLDGHWSNVRVEDSDAHRLMRGFS